MAKTKISEFSATPANNTDIDSINIAEGCAPSGINDAIRELMAQLKDFQTGAVGDSFNGPVGTATAAAGAFTTLSASSTLGVTGVATLGAGAILNTPASVTLTNATGLPIATGVSGLGTGVATFLATPSSANLLAAVTNETGTGSLVFATSPTLVTPVLGVATGTSFQGIIGNVTPAAGAFTSLTASTTLGVTGVATFSAGTAALPALTTTGDTNTGIFFPAADTVAVSTAGSERLRLTSTGNLGLAVTPSAWFSTSRAMQLGVTGSIFARTNTEIVGIASNAYNDVVSTTAFKYLASGNAATNYVQTTGQHRWFNAPSGTAEADITFTQAMTLDASGNLYLGATSGARGGAGTRQLVKLGTSQSFLELQSASTTSTTDAVMFSDGSTGNYGQVGYNHNVDALNFFTASTERMRIDSAGNVGIGTSSPTAGFKLDVNGSVRLGNGALTAIDSASSLLSYFGVFDSNTTQINSYTGTTPKAIVFRGYTTEYARFDSSGNLGLGVTPSAWASTPFRAMQVGAGAAVFGHQSTVAEAYLSSNLYVNAGNKFIGTGYAALYGQSAGVHYWYTSTASGTAGNAITFTQAMTLDANGRLVVGGTSASGIVTVQRLSGAAGIAQGIGFKDQSGNNIGAVSTEGATSNALQVMAGTGNDIRFYTNSDLTSTNERARIDTSGNLLVGATSVGASNSFAIEANAFGAGIVFNTNFNGRAFSQFQYTGTAVGSIVVNSTSTSYNTSSDYRLKNTIATMTGALAKVALLKPCTYKWNVDGSDGQGFIAHELAEVVPQCVSGEKDAVDAEGNPKYQGIDTSFLVATLTAAIQEAHGLIKSLETRITALEAK
jgi:hypothetical protein